MAKDRNGNQTSLTYDGSGFLTGVTDPSGRTLTLTVTNGYVTAISDAFGSVASYSYVPSTNRLETVTYPDGSKYQFEYDTTAVSGKVFLKTVKDALGYVLETHLYDSQGRATTSELDGGVEKYTLDYSNSAYTTVTDALSRVTKYYFDRSSVRTVIKKIDGVCACGGSGTETTQFQYDFDLRLTKKTDALGRETSYTYDNNHNITSIADVFGTQYFTYNSFGQVLTATDRMGGMTTNTYDPSGNLLTSTDPLSQTTTFTYTPQGQLETIEDAREKVTTLMYYPTTKMLWKVKDANNKYTTFTYDARARVETVTNALTETTTLEYDLNNRIKKVTHPDAYFVENKYDLAGRLEWRKNELGHKTTFGYDNAYRLTSVTDPLLHVKTYEYDLMSNLKKYTDGEGNVTEMKYDDFNRLEKITYPLPAMGETQLNEQYTYDATGRIKTHKDTAARTTSYNYDDINRRVTITDPMTQITKLDFNPRFQMIKVIDAKNQQYDFTYDPFGRVLTSTRAGGTMTMEYNEVGNRKKRTDYNGNVTNYAYDDLNRLTDVTYTGASGENATYGYDELHRLKTATNQNGTVTFTYDNRGRLKTETDVYGQVMESVYDAASRRTALKLNSNVHTSYAYDNADRLEVLTDETAANWTFGYDNADKLKTQAAPNGITTTYDYDGMSRLRRLKHVRLGTSIYDFQYAFNSANQISQITNSAVTKAYSYDDVNRLTGVAGSATESYAYDAVGNRTSSHLSASYTTGTFNKLTATSLATYAYNDNGSMTGKVAGAFDWTYGWDRENRMVSATVVNGRDPVYYAYDALGRRVKRTLGSAIEKYTYDGQDVVRDDDSGTARTYQNGPGIDNKLKYNASNGARYFMQDHLGSTIGTANATGIRRNVNTYDSYGNPSDPNYQYRYQFTGREYDSFTGLQYSRARFYDPQVGRFVSEDPIGFEGGDVNLYGYVWNNPQNFTDPMGLDGWGNDAANQLDGYIEYARRFYKGDDQEWKRNGTVDTIADLASGAADMLRCGSGTGEAYYANDENGYGRAANVATDVARCSAIFTTIAGPLSRIPRAGGTPVTVVEGEACPTRSFNPFKGKTPPEIDEMFKAKGYKPMGPDPMNGEGSYVNPRTGRGYHLNANHPPPKPPHVGVHRPRGKRKSMDPRDFDL